MAINKKNLYAFILLFIGITGFFYFDKGLMTGTDNACYFDLAYLVHKGGKFLVDYIDYRIPVFPWVMSWVYYFNWSDFTNRYIALVGVYFAYIVLIMKLSLDLTKSLTKSVLIALITFITITARVFDDSRNILQPLFHHVLELASLMILLKYFELWRTRGKANPKQRILMGLSGALAGVAFIGRQVNLFPILIMIFFSFYSFRQPEHRDPDIHSLNLTFFGGLLISLLAVSFKFITFDAENLKLCKMWLLEMPRFWHNPHRLMTRGLLIGLLEFRNIKLPLFFATYFCAGIYLLRITMNLIGQKVSMIAFRGWLSIHKQQLLLLVALIAMYSINVMPTGIGPARYEAPLITIYACLCSLFVKEISLWFKNLKSGYKVLLLLPLIAYLANFSAAEAKSYEISNKHINDQQGFYNDQIAAALKSAMTEPDQIVLVLGGKPVVCRLAKYKPFMGFNGDLLLLAVEKLNNEKLLREIETNLKEVKLVYKLTDYPNIRNTQLQSKIENLLNSSFIIKQQINVPDYNTVIYVRKP